MDVNHKVGIRTLSMYRYSSGNDADGIIVTADALIDCDDPSVCPLDSRTPHITDLAIKGLAPGSRGFRQDTLSLAFTALPVMARAYPQCLERIRPARSTLVFGDGVGAKVEVCIPVALLGDSNLLGRQSAAVELLRSQALMMGDQVTPPKMMM